MLDPEMPAQEMRLHMGEMTAQEMRTARAAIRWANNVAGKSVPKAARDAALEEAASVAEERSATLPNDDDFTRGYAIGRSAAAAAIRALSGSPTGDGWRDISTAPHETNVLLAWRDWAVPSTWLMEAGMASWGHTANGISNRSLHGWATHWRPLPPPPGKGGA